LYHPAAEDRRACAALSLAEFRERYWKPDRPATGLLFYRAHWQSGNLGAVDQIVESLDRAGSNALPVFCYSSRDQQRAQSSDGLRLFETYFRENSEPAIDCLVTLLGYSMADLERQERTITVRPELTKLGIPVLQAVSTMQPLTAWRENEAGMTPLDAAMYIVMPEFDGRLTTSAVAFREDEPGESGSGQRTVSLPDRADALARLARGHAQLRRKPNGEKRLALVLTNFANKQGRIGSAVGLDTPASVVELLKSLKTRGYQVSDIPADGDELMQRLIAHGGYDREFLTEDQVAASEASYTVEQYGRWFEEFPAKNRTALAERWQPAPGVYFRSGDRLYLAGIRLGNIFVMIQPPRGFGENPLEVYHSGELIPTHHYLGVYRWLREEFQADAVVQCGKHGTLEWLPGKALGLSEECWPELAIQDLPVFYPFIINDPGEGSQAKRRMHACIIDHLIPPMAQAETYDELAKLQQLLGAFANSEQIDPDKLPLIMDEIWEVVVEAKLHVDLGAEAKPREDDYGDFIQHIDGYLCEIGDMQIRDGLHVLGRPPEGEQLVNLALALVRLDAPGVAGLRGAVARDLGLDYEALNDRERYGERWSDSRPGFYDALPAETAWRTRGDILTGLEHLCRRVVEALAERSFTPEAVAPVAQRFGLATDGAARKTLGQLAAVIIPNVLRSTEEVGNLLDGLEGRFVPPGPSGAPTRGMANVLPTGRNFYSVDARAVPSPFAWKVGCQLGDRLIDSYQERHGRPPREIGITIWGTANMRTQGDDIAEILWLLGVAPVWQSENGRVVDLRVIPLEELGRPRVDVTVRMSGFFRDAFPGVVQMIDRAVNLVADLDEPDGQNALRECTRAEEKSLAASGATPADARARSRYRLFSNKPGAYGTGILNAIAEGAWESLDDLSSIYLEWGGFAYTAESHGQPAVGEFKTRLAASEVAVQNLDNREHDIFDSDDYLQFHGGMVAAIRTLTGRKPDAVLGDSSNPEQVHVDDLAKEARRIFRARVANPKWLKSIRRHGYKGALEMAATVDYLFGYDATANIVDDWMYEDVAQKYTLDEESRRFLEQSNPWALRELTGRLIEAASRGLWSAPKPETLDALKQAYLSTEGSLEEQGDPR
ncbi:MAG: cobaltochelatase subunit CobN, partial [Bryobacterales bacterium]|nr:cobaltochelatase subunit CobN [Bryobacterales bacterium]